MVLTVLIPVSLAYIFNPFNTNCTIQYALNSEVKVNLIVYDILGCEIKKLVYKKQQPGWYEVEFHASGLPSGLYFYKISAGDFIQMRKMMVIR